MRLHILRNLKGLECYWPYIFLPIQLLDASIEAPRKLLSAVTAGWIAIIANKSIIHTKISRADSKSFRLKRFFSVSYTNLC